MSVPTGKPRIPPKTATPAEQHKNARRKLRYANLKQRKPPDYIYIDEALDRLGEKLQPDLWGKTDTFDYLPFHWVGKQKKYFYREIVFNDEFGYVGENTLLEYEESEKSSLKRTLEIFESVCERLRDALYAGQVPFILFNIDEATRKSVEDLSIVYSMYLTLFHTGYVIRGPFPNKIKYRVLIDKAAFEGWLATVEPEPPGAEARPEKPVRPPPYKPVDRHDAEKVMKVLKAYTERTGHRFTQAELKSLIADALEIVRVSGEQFEKMIWTDLRDTAGSRGGKPVKEAQEAARNEVLPQLRACLKTD